MSNTEGAGPIKWLCFLIPIVGLVLYFMWQAEKPVAAKECGKFALIGVAVSFGLGVLGTCASVLMVASVS